MKKKNVWIPLLATVLLAATLFGVFSVLSNNLMDDVKEIQNRVESNLPTNTGGSSNSSGGTSVGGASDPFIVPEGMFEMARPIVATEKRMRLNENSEEEEITYAGMKFVAYVDADIVAKYNNSNYEPRWLMLYAPASAFYEVMEGYKQPDLEQNWVQAFGVCEVGFSLLATNFELAQDSVGNHYYKVVSNMFDISDDRFLSDYCAILYCELRAATYTADEFYAAVDIDASINFCEAAMEALNVHYYSASMNLPIYDEASLIKLKESIYYLRYKDKFLVAPSRNSNGELSRAYNLGEEMSYIDYLSAMGFVAVLENTYAIVVGVGRTVELDYRIDPFEPYFGVPILLGDSTEYFTTKGGNITGVAPCENAPLHVSICGQPYTILVTVK